MTWIIPLLVTVLVMICATIAAPVPKDDPYLADFESIALGGLYALAAAVISGAAWIIWWLV